MFFFKSDFNYLLSFFRPSHTSLKSRERGQNTAEDLASRDFKRELEQREKAAIREKEKGRNAPSASDHRRLQMEGSAAL